MPQLQKSHSPFFAKAPHTVGFVWMLGWFSVRCRGEDGFQTSTATKTISDNCIVSLWESHINVCPRTNTLLSVILKTIAVQQPTSVCFSTLLVSWCTLRERASFTGTRTNWFLFEQIPALPVRVSRVSGLLLVTHLSPSPQGTIHPQHWHLLCPCSTRPSHQRQYRDNERNRRQWGTKSFSLGWPCF